MGTLDRPSSGTVRVTGLDVAALSDRELSALRAARIGFVFQQFFLAEHATVLDNVADGLLYAGAGTAERAPGRGRGAGPGRPRPPAATPARRSSPAASASGSRSPARWSAGRPSCWPTSRPATSTAPPGRSILGLLAELHADGSHHRGDHPRPRTSPAGMPRRVEMLDGRIVADTPPHEAPMTRSDRARPGAAPGRPGPRWPASACAPAAAGRACPRWASRSASPPSWPCSACPRPPRPGCSTEIEPARHQPAHRQQRPEPHRGETAELPRRPRPA